MSEHANNFPRDFLWGTATAAYQIEGAVREDGRGPSIWDTFSRVPGKTVNGDTGDTACDHYHRYREDVDIMAAIGTNAYRFSLAWPRFFPEGRGRMNAAGAAFYDRLTDTLLERGIVPTATLYHWDLPQALQDSGGWLDRGTADRFAEYAAAAFEFLGDRIGIWYTLNEPWVSAFAGHWEGKHAPGIADLGSAVLASHHLVLAHAKAVQVFRESAVSAPRASIGPVLNLYPVEAATASDDDAEAALFVDGFSNRWFLDPFLRGRYPDDMVEFYRSRGLLPTGVDADTPFIASQRSDFLGVNYYFRKIVRKSDSNDAVPIEFVVPKDALVTEMGWEVHAPGLFDLLSRIAADYGNPVVYITENGAAFEDPAPSADPVHGTVIEDPRRVEFLEAHLAEVARAVRGGIRVGGYFAWSLLDNFEWGFGYSKRFGLVGVDYATGKRTLKRSALAYRDFLARL